MESDNSIIYGVPDNTIQKTNFALVEQVRKDYPDSYIIYKPHPDTESGLRAKGTEDDLLMRMLILSLIKLHLRISLIRLIE